ncbi:MAG: prepilin-type N-terminal cleavage/methylation domain-containing protein [Moraxellaceae bacterium]
MLYQAGFGLVELLVVVALIGILASVALPSLSETQQYYERFKVERISQQLLQEGRNTAFSLRQRIIICGSQQATSCDPVNWQEGMLMFHDVNLDHLYSPDVDVVLRFEPLNLKYGTWRWIGGVKLTTVVVFEHTSGMPHASYGSFHYCDFEQKHLFRLVMRNTGVLRKSSKDVRC